MFRFLELTLHGWDLWPPVRVPLDRDVVLVSGPNGSGKTTLLDAIRQLLNAPRLSSRRRVQAYLRRAERPAIISAVVSNVGGAGRMPPFARERIHAPEVTLGCALVPDRSGSPQKRFCVLPGRASLEELRRVLFESREHHSPERYESILRAAGVSRSLMGVLAIEQGRTNSLFELKPRELFRKVLEMTGDHAVLERYREARRRYEDSRGELYRQSQALQAKDDELRAARRRVRVLEDWEEARDKVAELERRLPASRLQELLHRRSESASKQTELRTKLLRGESGLERLTSERDRALAEERRTEAELEGARERESEARGERDRTRDRLAEARAALARLEAAEAELEALGPSPAGRELAALDRELGARELSREQAELAWARAHRHHEDARSELEEAQRLLDELESGGAAHPREVALTLDELAQRGVETRLLAATAEVVEPAVVEAVEAALAEARFALLVAQPDETVALEVARRHAFPGPVAAGGGLEEPRRVGPLQLDRGAPEWVEDWLSGVELRADGTWSDRRGRWLRPADAPRLGESARARRVESQRSLVGEASAAEERAAAGESSARSARLETERAVEAARRRLALCRELERLHPAREELREAEAAASAADAREREAKRAWEAAHEAHREAGLSRTRAEDELRQAGERLKGEREGLRRLEVEASALETVERELLPSVPAGLLDRARAGELDGEDTVRADLGRARLAFESQGEPPPPECREEARVLAENVEELSSHVRARRDEAEAAEGELAECRSRYLEVVLAALQDYRRRAGELARVAEVALEMELPRLSDDERSLDEAALEVRFGFDGKPPLPLGDPSFSGGQQVIAGLVLLLAMAETEGRGFFMLDEPFAHLSLDRVDQVGRFLRGTRSQFLLTAPTTLDRAQLDPASLVIVLSKKRADEASAPLPIVAVA